MITPNEHYPELAKAIGLSDLYFKREDLHLYGSHKGRSIPVMIDHYHKDGDCNFAISSSGNAALAAAFYISKLNSRSFGTEISSNQNFPTTPINLDIFVGNHVAPHKLEKLKAIEAENSEHIRILVKERPLQALAQAVEDGARSLRQSTDDEALIGYESLAEELSEIKNIGAVVIGTSSGTTAQALANYFLKEKLPIQVHIVQTSSCHPLADAFESYDGSDDKSKADAIVDQTAHRKLALVPLIKKTGGYGWVATNDDIDSALDFVEKHTDISISTNSALSVVGAMKIAYTGKEIKGTVVCMICGD